MNFQNINFEEINTTLEFDYMYALFLEIIKENTRRFIKHRTFFFTPKLIWWTPELGFLRNKVAVSYKKLKSPLATLVDHLKYKNEKHPT